MQRLSLVGGGIFAVCITENFLPVSFALSLLYGLFPQFRNEEKGGDKYFSYAYPPLSMVKFSFVYCSEDYLLQIDFLFLSLRLNIIYHHQPS